MTDADNSELAAVPGSESELIEQSSSSVRGLLANGGLLLESGSESELWEQSSSSFGGLLAHEGLLSENASTEDEFVEFACEGPSSENPKPDILLGDLNAEGYIGIPVILVLRFFLLLLSSSFSLLSCRRKLANVRRLVRLSVKRFRSCLAKDCFDMVFVVHV